MGVGERNVSVSQILLSLDRVGRKITPRRHPTLRYKSKTEPRPSKVTSHVRTKKTIKGFPDQARRFWPGVRGRLDPDPRRGWLAPHGRGDRANTSPATRSIASQSCVARVASATARSCTSLRPGRTTFLNSAMYPPLYFSRSAATCALVVAKSVVQAPLGGGMHVNVMYRFSYHGLYPLSASVCNARARLVSVWLLRFE